MNNNSVVKTENQKEMKGEKVMDILRPSKVKSLNDEGVAEYLKWVTNYKSIEQITDEINSALTPRAKKVTADEVAKHYMELQQTNTELTKEQLYKMTKTYLESTGKYKCTDYKWLQDHAFIIDDMLMKLKKPNAYELSAKIFKRYNKVVATRCIVKHFRKVGIYLPLGDRQKAIKRCGTYYRKKLNRVENYNKNKKKEGNK